MPAPSRPCIECKRTVRPKQDSLTCAVCSGRQHRTCSPLFSREEYWSMKRNGDLIMWRCNNCQHRNLEDLLNSASEISQGTNSSIGVPAAESTAIQHELGETHVTPPSLQEYSVQIPNIT
ncbi:unnamed protein product, partial [Owenia fusiformis]